MAHYVVAHITIKPEARGRFVELLREHVSLSLQGEGCEAFDVKQDVSDECKLVYVERYTTKAAFDRHITSSRVVTFLQETGQLLAMPADFAEYEDLKSL